MYQVIGGVVLMLASAGVVLAADVLPPSGSQSETRPGEPVPPSNPPAPPPSTIDPGIQKTPETVPDPKSAVSPPRVDPEMVIDPEKPRKSDDVPSMNRPGTPPVTPPAR